MREPYDRRARARVPGVGGALDSAVQASDAASTSQASTAEPSPHLSGALPTESTVLDTLSGVASSGIGETVDAAIVPPGWESRTGDWRPDPERFPGGLRALRDTILTQHVKAGLALSPRLVARSSEVYQSHPEWILRSPTGGPILAGTAADELYILDGSQSEVQDWLRSLGNTISIEWGFALARSIDSTAAIQAGWRSNGACSPVATYRAGLGALRSGLSYSQLIVGGGPLFAALDLADAIETSARPVRSADPTPLLRAFLGDVGPLTSAGLTWLDVPGQTLDQACAAATIATFAGGLVQFAGGLAALSPERRQVARVCLPPFQGAVLPLDPFVPGGPRLFGAQVRQSWDDWLLLIALNPTDRSIAIVAGLAELGLAGRHHAFEFWSQSYLGIVDRRLALDNVPPGGCAVVALRPVQSTPQVLGTSLHVSLGAVDLQDARFDPDAGSFHLSVGVAGDRAGTVTFYVPLGWRAGTIRGTGGTFSLEILSGRVVQLHLDFRDVADVDLEFSR